MLKISCDDGCVSDLRLAELCKKYNVECIFYWPVEWHTLAHEKGYEPLGFNQANRISADFEVGAHTITHRILTKVELAEAKYEIIAGKVILGRLFGKDINKFAPPRGYTNKELTDYTLEIYNEQRLTKGEGLVHIHPDSGANNNRPWREAITDKTEELWGHSWELDKFDLWGELEDYLKSQS